MKKGIHAISLMAFGLIAISPAGATDWTGPYVGGSVGYGWGKGDTQFHALPSPSSFSILRSTKVKTDPDGFLLGPQIGYNWQRGRVLFGVEGDISWSGMDGSKKVHPIIQDNGTHYPGAGYLSAEQDINWLSTIRGRIGFVPSDQWIAYFTAGAAIADVDYRADTNFRPTGAWRYPASMSKTEVGWTAGVGTEWAFSDKWSAKAEYLYCDLGSESKTARPHPANPPYKVRYKWDTEAHIIRVGVNYHWGKTTAAPAPPPAVEEVKPVEPPPPPPPPPAEVKPVVVAPPPPPPPAKIVLDQAVLHFANSKAVLSDEGVAAVQQVAQELKQYPGDYTLVVSGHTSSTGSKAFNKVLSKKRADAVAKVLVDSGIPATSIQTVGYGPDQPLMDNAMAEGQARNRRVEIEVKVKDASVETRTIQTQTQDTPKPTPKKKKKAPAAQ